MINTNRLSMQEKNAQFRRIDFGATPFILPNMVYRKFLEKKMVLAENIRRHLAAKNLQQNEFANQIGISPQHFSFYVTGKREPREDTLNRIAAGFGIDPLELYRIPSGMVDPHFEQCWNCLIEMQHNHKALEVANEFLKLISHLTESTISPEMLSAIKQIIIAAKKNKFTNR